MDLSHFPLADQPGTDFSDVDRRHLRLIAETSKPISESEFNHILQEHTAFIKAGGGGGQWQTMNINGVVMGIYLGPKIHIGNQAVLNNQRLEKSDLQGMVLTYANMVGILAENADWSKTKLDHSLITDAMLAGTSFENASLMGVDFSRSDLRGCIFQGANCKYTDFENCNLEGADFRGAKLDKSRFPGANLKNCTI